MPFRDGTEREQSSPPSPTMLVTRVAETALDRALRTLKEKSSLLSRDTSLSLRLTEVKLVIERTLHQGNARESRMVRNTRVSSVNWQ